MTYFSIPEAAQRLGLPRMTLFRWVTRRYRRDLEIQAVRDRITGRHYMTDDAIAQLAARFEPARFQPVGDAEGHEVRATDATSPPELPPSSFIAAAIPVNSSAILDP